MKKNWATFFPEISDVEVDRDEDNSPSPHPHFSPSKHYQPQPEFLEPPNIGSPSKKIMSIPEEPGTDQDN